MSAGTPDPVERDSRQGPGPRVPRAFRRILAVLVVSGSALAGTAKPSASGFAPGGPPRGRAYYLYSLSQQAQLQRNFVDALKYLEEAVQSDGSAELRVELADLYLSLNQTREAEEEARKAISEDSSSVAARRLLAQILTADAPGGEERAQRLQEAEGIYRGLLQEGKADDDSVMSLADLQTDRGDSDAARAVLEAYRTAHPGSSAVDVELARIYRLDGRLEDAISLLQGVVEREKDNLEARGALGNCLEEAGRFEEAARVYTALVDQNPNNPYAHYRLAVALISLQKYQEAQQHLIVALKADSANVRLLLALGQAYEGTHDYPAAVGAYQQVLKRDSTSMEARFFLARIHQNRGEDEEALALYAEILSKNAGLASPQEKAFYSVAATQVGLIRLLQKNYPAALGSLGQAYQASEKPGSGLFALLGRTYIAAGQIEAAEKILAEGRERYPDDEELGAMEGEILLRKSQSQEARQRFDSLLVRAKESEAGYLEVVQACVRAEKLTEAEPYLKAAVQKYPESRDLLFQDAALDERLGRFKQAEKKFREILRKQPDDGEALNYLGYMLADRGVKLQEALEMLEKAVTLDGENVAFLDSLGWVNYRLGRYAKAESYLILAARGSRIDPTILDHLGDARAALGKKDEALEAYRTALQHQPENPEGIRKKIRKLGSDPDKP